MVSFGSHQWHTHVINDRPHFTLLAHQETLGLKYFFPHILVFTVFFLTSDWAVGVAVGCGMWGRETVLIFMLVSLQSFLINESL